MNANQMKKMTKAVQKIKGDWEIQADGIPIMRSSSYKWLLPHGVKIEVENPNNKIEIHFIGKE